MTVETIESHCLVRLFVMRTLISNSKFAERHLDFCRPCGAFESSDLAKVSLLFFISTDRRSHKGITWR